ncbi:MAG: hypothetical protein ACKPGK_00895, partial [Verrucomicrobiota bacterium]
MRSIPGLLESWGASDEAKLAARPRLRPRRVVATGPGSSEAHARYLVWFLNRFTDIPAEFLPTGALVEPVDPARFRDRTLVVFNQGLSAAGRIALGHRAGFDSTVLFTSATAEGLRRSGRTERLECLEPLERDDTVEIIRFPLEDEYTILIRVVGPALGFLAARLWAGSFARPGDFCGDPRSLGIEAARAFRAGRDAGHEAWPRMDGAAFSRGFVLLASPDLSEYLQNVVYKFVEGLFRPAPALQELLQFAHGPFQQLTASPRPVVVLHRRCETESDQLRRIRQMARVPASTAWPRPPGWCLRPTCWSSRPRAFSSRPCWMASCTGRSTRWPGLAGGSTPRSTTTSVRSGPASRRAPVVRRVERSPRRSARPVRRPRAA